MRLGLRAAVLAALLPLEVLARPCTDYGATARWMGGLSFGNAFPNADAVLRIDVDGDLAYLAAADADLRVVSLADPTDLRQITFRGFSGYIVDLARDGDLLALARDHEGVGRVASLVLYDVTNRAVPLLRGSLAFADAYSLGILALRGDRAVVSVWRRGLHVVDVSDPAAPRDLGRLEEGNYFTDFTFVSEEIAYAAERDYGLVFYDFSGSFPVRREESLPGPWTRFAHEPGSRFGYAAGVGPDGELLVASVDVSEPLRPRVVDTLVPDCPRTCIFVHSSWPSARDIAVSGPRVAVATNGGNVLVDASNPGALVSRGLFQSPRVTDDLAFAGSFLCLAEGIRGFHVYEFDPFRTAAVGERFPSDPDRTDDTWVGLEWTETLGRYAYLTEFATIPDYEDPTDWWQYEIVDLLAPGGPQSLAVIRNGPDLSVSRFHATDGRLFGTWFRELHTLSLADPANPVRRGTVSVSTGSYLFLNDVEADGPRVFAAAEGYDEGYLVEFDVSDPDRPAFVAMEGTGTGAKAVALRGDHAYVAAGSGVVVLELLETGPRRVGVVSTGPSAVDVELVGEAVYVALGNDYVHRGRPALLALDVSDPAAPVERAELGVPQAAYALERHGDFLYVASEWAGVTVVDVRDPFRPVIRGGAATSGRPKRVRAAGEHLLASDGSGFDLVPYECATRLTSGVAEGPRPSPSIAPNPTAGGAGIRFRLAAPGGVTLGVYDVAGRLVRALRHTATAAGPQHVSWDGRDTRGRQVTSGVYFLRLEGDRFSSTSRIVVAR